MSLKHHRFVTKPACSARLSSGPKLHLNLNAVCLGPPPNPCIYLCDNVLQSMSVGPLPLDAPLGAWRVAAVALRPEQSVVDVSTLEFIVASAIH